jgi:hypothetical protein
VTRAEDPRGQLRDLLAVIDSSAALLGRHLPADVVADRHLRRIREHVKQATELLRRADIG